MDREADDYALFAELKEAGLRFVVRANDQRYTEGGQRLEDLLEAAPSHTFALPH